MDETKWCNQYISLLIIELFCKEQSAKLQSNTKYEVKQNLCEQYIIRWLIEIPEEQ